MFTGTEDTSVWKQYSDIHQDKEKSSSLHEENQILKVWINNGLMKYSEQYHTSPNTSSKEQYFSVFRIVFKSASSFSTSHPVSSGILSSNGIRLFIRVTDSGSCPIRRESNDQNYLHLKPFDLYRRIIHLTKNGDEYEKSL